MNEQDELVEKFLDIISDGRKAIRDNCFDEFWTPYIQQMLSVVRENIGEIAEVCPECGGSPEGVPSLISSDGGFGGGVVHNNCKLCRGTGVVPKGASDGKR